MQNTIKKLKYQIHLNPQNVDKILENVAKNSAYTTEEIKKTFENDMKCSLKEYAKLTEDTLLEEGLGDVVNVLSRTFTGKDLVKTNKPSSLKSGIGSRAFDKIRSQFRLGPIGVSGQLKAQARNEQRKEFDEMYRSWVSFREKTMSKKNTVDNMINFSKSKLNPVKMTPGAVEKALAVKGFKKKEYDERTAKEFFKNVIAFNFELEHKDIIKKEADRIEDKWKEINQQISKEPELKKLGDKVTKSISTGVEGQDMPEIMKLMTNMEPAQQKLVLDYAQLQTLQ